jgi:ABC-type Co2+ transport system permease subunit
MKRYICPGVGGTAVVVVVDGVVVVACVVVGLSSLAKLASSESEPLQPTATAAITVARAALVPLPMGDERR